jgi:hypothetical protein
MVRRAWRVFQLGLMIGAVRIGPRERGVRAPVRAHVPPRHAVHHIHGAVANGARHVLCNPPKPCIVSSASRDFSCMRTRLMQAEDLADAQGLIIFNKVPCSAFARAFIPPALTPGQSHILHAALRRRRLHWRRPRARRALSPRHSGASLALRG